MTLPKSWMRRWTSFDSTGWSFLLERAARDALPVCRSPLSSLPPGYSLAILYKSIANLAQSHLLFTTFCYRTPIHTTNNLVSSKVCAQVDEAPDLFATLQPTALAGEEQIRGSGGSLEPPGPLPTHLHTVHMAYSECLRTRLDPLAERTCSISRCW